MQRILRSCWSFVANLMEDPQADTVRQSAQTDPSQYLLTKEDFENGMESHREELKNIIDGKLNKYFSTSLVNDIKRVNSELLKTALDYEDSIKKALEENANLLQMYNAQSITLQEWEAAYERQQKEFNKLQKAKDALQMENEKLKSDFNARGSYQREECLQAKRKVKELQRDFELQAKQLSKVSVMKQFEVQHESKHEELSSQYEALWTNVALILEELEKHFEDRFHAKVFLSKMFMEAHKRSKRHLKDLIIDTLNELHKVQVNEHRLENISRIFGLLLDSSQARTEEVQKNKVVQICKEIKRTLSLPAAKETLFFAKETLLTADIPLEKVVEVAWKFVTQPCPLIVDQPDRFNVKIHDTNARHWDEKQKDLPLIYAKPVVYRSYHGILLSRALVGNHHSVVSKSV